MPFITDAPAMVLAQIEALGARISHEDAFGAPAWADQFITVHEPHATLTLVNLRDAGYRVEAWMPRPAEMSPVVRDPVYALAASREDPERGGSAPAQAWVR